MRLDPDQRKISKFAEPTRLAAIKFRNNFTKLLTDEICAISQIFRQDIRRIGGAVYYTPKPDESDYTTARELINLIDIHMIKLQKKRTLLESLVKTEQVAADVGTSIETAKSGGGFWYKESS